MPARRGAALFCLLVWVGLLLASVLLGHRDSSFSDLKTAVALDYVNRIEVSGSLGSEGRGVEVVEVQWRRGLFHFSTLVVEERPPGAAGRGPRDDEDVTAILDRPAVEVLRDIDPGVTSTTVARSATGPTVLGWDTPLWAALVLALALVTTVWLLATGPPPRGATRWGWCWLLLLTPPIGLIGYPLFSGVLSRFPDPVPDQRPWLTGTRAFLLGAVVCASWVSATVNDVMTL